MNDLKCPLCGADFPAGSHHKLACGSYFNDDMATIGHVGYECLERQLEQAKAVLAAIDRLRADGGQVLIYNRADPPIAKSHEEAVAVTRPCGSRAKTRTFYGPTLADALRQAEAAVKEEKEIGR